MKLLLYDMGAYTQNDIMDALDKLGISYKNVLYKLSSLYQDAYFEKRIAEFLTQEKYDAVFSINYYPVLAEICYSHSLPYLSWTYDSPIQIPEIEKTLGYKTNYIFFFDKAECENYWKKGYYNVFHLPLAVNTHRLDKVKITEDDKKKYQAQISMVGQLYETGIPTYMMPLELYDKGYLSGVIETQLRLYGSYILKDVITDEIVDRINKRYKALKLENVTLTKEILTIEMAKHITCLERTLILEVLSNEYQVKLYGPDGKQNLGKVTWMGSAGYFDEMPKVFKLSDINLNISLKCIASGIPLRVLDIMGCGGFLISNYQPELAEYFTDGEDIVWYTSLEEVAVKCQYYLQHEAERREIAQKGYEKVKELFCYENRLLFMLQKAGLQL